MTDGRQAESDGCQDRQPRLTGVPDAYDPQDEPRRPVKQQDQAGSASDPKPVDTDELLDCSRAQREAQLTRATERSADSYQISRCLKALFFVAMPTAFFIGLAVTAELLGLL